MFNYILLLLLIGFAMSAIEIFMPGFGFFGVVGLLCMVASATLTIMHIPFGFMIVATEIVVISVLIYFIVKWAKSRQLYGSLILKEILSQEKPETGNFDTLIGKEGVTCVPLKPFGSVVFNGVKLDAYSDGAFIPKGRTVKVVDAQNDKITVREVN